MDNLTHTLFALTLARTPLARAGRGTTAALVLASNAPDIDIVARVGGTDAYLRWHRGPTHGPLGIVALGLLVAVLVRLGLPFLDKSSEENAAASWPMLIAVSMIGVFCHVLMDFPTSYGTRMLSPFDWHWFAVDWMPIVDVYLLFALGAGLLFGSLSREARPAKRRDRARVDGRQLRRARGRPPPGAPGRAEGLRTVVAATMRRNVRVSSPSRDRIVDYWPRAVRRPHPIRETGVW